MHLQSGRIWAGAAAGLLATVPMSAIMLLGKRLLPWLHRDPLPPAWITERATQAVGLDDLLTHAQRLELTVVSHFGYGAAAGAAYGAITPRATSLGAAAATGVVYGLGVWAASYLGWVPAAGLYRPPQNEPRERHLVMISAHMIWGASLGLLEHTFAERMSGRRQAAVKHADEPTERQRMESIESW